MSAKKLRKEGKLHGIKLPRLKWRGLLPAGHNRRQTVLGAGVGLAVALFFLLVSHLGWLNFFEWMSLDARFVGRFLAAPATDKSPVTVVAIDDRAVETYGRWPWPRAIQAELIMAILDAEPAVLGVDIIYSELDDAWSDSRLAQALGRPIPVVLAAAQTGEGELFPDETFRAPNVRIGHINTSVDGDGVVRRLSWEIETRFGPLKPLSYEVAASQLLSQSLSEASSLEALPLEPPPLDPAGRMLVNYRPANPDGRLSLESIAETISAADVLEGRMRDRIAGRPVLLGVTAAGLETHDRHLTPLRPLGSIPGVYIHAAAVSAFLDGEYVRKSDGVPGASWALVVGVAMGIAAFRFRPWRAAGVFFLFLIGIGAAALWRFSSAGIWVPLAAPYATLIVTYGAGLWFSHSQAVREADRIRETFRRYVAPEVVDYLLDRPGTAQVDGGRRQVTVLFADVRGFTAYAESLSPEVVVSQLNRYLKIMADSILLYDGMVDKFVGDGVMAIFGAPVPAEDHAERAIRAGLHMLRQIEVERQAAISKREPLAIGVGIHTGEAVVGSVGSPSRKEYTAIGDTVNVASRLQEMAPAGSLVVSEETLAKINGNLGMEVTPLGCIEIRGRTQAVNLFRLTPAIPEIDANDVAHW